MGRLLPAPRSKMYLIQLLRPPSTFIRLIFNTTHQCALSTTLLLSYGAPYRSTLFEHPHTCSSWLRPFGPNLGHRAHYSRRPHSTPPSL
jgi:hypothetical protein